MSTMLERPTPRTAVSDLRGSAPVPAPTSVLVDPTGRRRRVLGHLGRAISLVFVAWIAVLVLGGVGVIPAPGLPGSSVFRASSGPPALPRHPDGTRADAGGLAAVTASDAGAPSVTRLVPGADGRPAEPARDAAHGASRRPAARRHGSSAPARGTTPLRGRPVPARRSPWGPSARPRPSATARPIVASSTGTATVAAMPSAPATSSSVTPPATTTGTPPTSAGTPSTTPTTPPAPTAPGGSGSAPGQTTDPGNSASAPGRTTSPGKSGSSPGHTTGTTTTPTA